MKYLPLHKQSWARDGKQFSQWIPSDTKQFFVQSSGEKLFIF